MSNVKYVRSTTDGRYVFVREGVYFTLTLEDFEQLQQLFEELVKDKMEKDV